MKIKSVNRKQSGKDKIVLNTQPPLTWELFERFRPLFQAEPTLRSLDTEFSTSGALILSSSDFEAGSLPAGINQMIEQLLNRAESMMSQTEQVRRQQTELEKTQKDKALQAAAQAFGVPIE